MLLITSLFPFCFLGPNVFQSSSQAGTDKSKSSPDDTLKTPSDNDTNNANDNAPTDSNTTPTQKTAQILTPDFQNPGTF